MAGGGGGGPTSTTQTTSVELSPEQRELFNLALPALTEFAANPPQPFPGQTVAGFDPAQIAGQQTLVNQAQGGLTNLGQSALDASQFFLGPGMDPTSNPFLQAAIGAAVQPIVENFTQGILPNIRGEAITSGQFGGSRQGIAEGVASTGVSRAIGETASGLANQGFQASLEAATRALALAPQTGGLLLQPGGVLSAVGETRQGQQQAFLNDELNRYMQEQFTPYLVAKDVAGTAFGIPGASTIGAGTAAGGGPSQVQSALGGAAVGASLGSTFGTAAGPYGTAIGAGVGALAGYFGFLG